MSQPANCNVIRKMSPHVNDSASPAFRLLRATQFELCPSILVGLDTGAYWAPGMNTIGCFDTRSPASTTVMATTSTRSLEVIKSPNNEPEPELHSAKATVSSLAIGSLYQLVLLVFTCSAYARAGPSNCTKKAGTSGCRNPLSSWPQLAIGPLWIFLADLFIASSTSSSNFYCES